MKKLGILLTCVCVGLLIGCNNPQGQEAKEKMKEVGGELLKTGEKAGEAIKSGAESVINESKEALEKNKAEGKN
jgi:hypothetical protein